MNTTLANTWLESTYSINCSVPIVEGISTASSPIENTVYFAEKDISLSVQRGCIVFCLVECKVYLAERSLAVRTDSPKFAFAMYLELLHRTVDSCVSSQSIISPSAVIGSNVSIGDFSILEDGVVVGDDTQIGHGVVIKAGTSVGKRCFIEDGSVLGNSGLTVAMDRSSGDLCTVVHTGSLFVGNDVFVGARATLARGTIGDSVIADQTKIGPSCNIGHNCRLGERVVIAGASCLAGGVIVEDNCFIGANSSIKQKVVIGRGSIVGIGACVSQSIASDSTVTAVYAMTLRSYSKLKRLFR